jgi:nucleoid-associated protein YgaU
MNRLLRILGPGVAILTVILLAGCGGDAGSVSAETDDSAYREGQQLERQGRADEALAAYLKVIARRGDAAPESHLDAGILYLNHIKDPIAAIYHFRKYLELVPNSREAANVRGQIAAATREFARTLPGHPLDSQSTQLGLGAALEQLQRENDELKAEIAALHAGVEAAPAMHAAAAGTSAAEGAVSLPALGGASGGGGAGANGGGPVVVSEPDAGPDAGGATPLAAVPGGEQAPPARSGWMRVTVPGSAPASAPGSTAPAVTGTASRPALAASPGRATASTPGGPAGRALGAPAGHRHVVAKGDTLSNLAQKYYGSRAKWREILAANRDLLSGPNDLKIGMELKMP